MINKKSLGVYHFLISTFGFKFKFHLNIIELFFIAVITFDKLPECFATSSYKIALCWHNPARIFAFIFPEEALL